MTGRTLQTAGVVALVAVVAAAVAVPAVSQQRAGPQPSLTVDLRADGSAQVTVAYAFDLADGERAAAFEELRTNETATAAFEGRFRERMGRVAADASAATGREMRIEEVRVAFRTADGTGVVEASVAWRGLAAVDGDRLVVTEPFASGYEADRRVHLVAPDGYEVASAAPEPDSRSDGRLTWAAGTDLTGFDVQIAPSDADGAGGADGAGETGGASSPGFGVSAAVVALALGLGALARRR